MSTYYTLLINDGCPGEPWGIAFGDYDRDTVKAEYDDYRDRGWKTSEVKIIRTSDDQASIDAAVAALNDKEGRNT